MRLLSALATHIERLAAPGKLRRGRTQEERNLQASSRMEERSGRGSASYDRLSSSFVRLFKPDLIDQSDRASALRNPAFEKIVARRSRPESETRDVHSITQALRHLAVNAVLMRDAAGAMRSYDLSHATAAATGRSGRESWRTFHTNCETESVFQGLWKTLSRPDLAAPAREVLGVSETIIAHEALRRLVILAR